MIKKTGYIWLLMLLLALAGCSNEEPSQQVGLPISIYLPANEVQAAQYSPARRVMGDPGQAENFFFPHHLYVAVVKQNNDNTWSLWEIIERTLTDADWKARRYTGSLPTAGDSIYQYTENINLMLSSTDKFKGHVYAIASFKKLTFNRAFTKAGLGTVENLLNITFDASPDSIQKNLQHIYSTPYNLKVSGEYFGKFDSRYQRVPKLDLLLYHVAAKVDIKWNVVDSVRINKANPSAAVRLTYMEARRLFDGYAYCFKPLRNTLSAVPTSGGYDIPNMVTPTDEGLWWEGRKYFYTIPYTVEGRPGYFPLQMLMKTNDSYGSGYELTLEQTMDTTGVFVPWLRGIFMFTKPLENKTETKTI